MRTLARSLNPFQGGSNPRNLETTEKLQILQKLNVPSVEEGNLNLSIQDSPVYVGMDSHTPRLEGEKSGKEQKNVMGRNVEDGLSLVVPIRIYGKQVKALIDSRATRCFVTPSCIAVVGLKGIPATSS